MWPFTVRCSSCCTVVVAKPDTAELEKRERAVAEAEAKMQLRDCVSKWITSTPAFGTHKTCQYCGHKSMKRTICSEEFRWYIGRGLGHGCWMGSDHVKHPAIPYLLVTCKACAGTHKEHTLKPVEIREIT